jgi:hypothetical protein
MDLVLSVIDVDRRRLKHAGGQRDEGAGHQLQES